MLLGVDVGGTFTDAVLLDGEHGPHRQAADHARGPVGRGDRARSRRCCGGPAPSADEVEVFAHGMTVGTNALLEERGARTALIATRGFADLLEIGRQDRPELYRLCAPKPAPLVEPELRFEAAERVGPGGRRRAARRGASRSGWRRWSRESGAESVAICLLFSYLDPAPRAADRRAPARATCPGSTSPPRTRSCPASASTSAARRRRSTPTSRPLLGRYLGRLGEAAAGAGLPRAAGDAVLGRRRRGRGGGAGRAPGASSPGRPGARSAPGCSPAPRGDGNALGFDMGGTSCDVCVVEDGEVRRTDSREIGGRPIQLPMVDVHTVGAGGGSIGWRDRGGALRVGPHSAGAEPGPACYGILHTLGAGARSGILHTLGAGARSGILHTLGAGARSGILHTLGAGARSGILHTLGAGARSGILHTLGAGARNSTRLEPALEAEFFTRSEPALERGLFRAPPEPIAPRRRSLARSRPQDVVERLDGRRRAGADSRPCDWA